MYVLNTHTRIDNVNNPLLLYVPFSLSPFFQSVFRVYDKDSSGYISIDEFQSISSNFPFIESFSVLDRDK